MARRNDNLVPSGGGFDETDTAVPIPAPKRDTLDVRIKREVRDLIDRAALAREKNRTDFILTARK